MSMRTCNGGSRGTVEGEDAPTTITLKKPPAQSGGSAQAFPPTNATERGRYAARVARTYSETVNDEQQPSPAAHRAS